MWVTSTDMPYSEIKSECSDSLPKQALSQITDSKQTQEGGPADP